MKKLLALALSLTMVLGLLAACAPAADKQSPAPSESVQPTETPKAEPSGKLIVGANAMNADMFEGWTNLTANKSIKDLINGYATVAYTENDEFIIDPVVVKDFKQTENADGSKTYEFEINEGLTYNDGTKITAKDYVFAALMGASPELTAMENDTAYSFENYLGFVEYNEGTAKALKGLHLLGDNKFSITIAAADSEGTPNFPFWFELTYALVAPYPMHILAPGCDVKDTADGAIIEGPWSLELLKSTLDDGSKGYRYTPTLSAGAYKFISFDASSNQAVLEVNDKYAGDYDGAKPMIKTLVVKLVEDATATEELRTGAIDLYTGVSGGSKITAGLDLVDTGKFEYTTYARNGYGKILFHCSKGPTQFEEVRRAIAYSLDREEFVRQYTGGYGVMMNSRIGNAQWTYTENKAELDKTLTNYTLNLDKAKEELVNGGWTLNKDGKDFVEGTDKVRYKKLDDGSLMPLHIEWFSPNSNAVGEMLATFFTANATSLGFEINQTFGDSSAFGAALYGTSEVYYHMVNGGSGFATADSPWYYYDPARFGPYNSNLIDDKELNETTQVMKATKTGDRASYSAAWMKFVLRFNRILPDLPLYSDEYHDFFAPKLKNYKPTALWSWDKALIRATVSE